MLGAGLATTFITTLFVTPAPTLAHGPCGCIKPATVAPGTRTEVESRAILAIWNPRLSDFRYDPGLQLRDLRWRRPDQPTEAVFESDRATEDFTFEAPNVDPGRYLLLVYDGTEGGDHSTWDYVRVIGSPDSAELTDDGIGLTLPTQLLALGALGVVLCVIFRLRRGR